MPIVLSGVDELKRALKKYAPDLRKEMDATIKGELKSVIDETKQKVPSTPPGRLYNWQDKGREPISRTHRERGFPLYNALEVRRGLTYRAGTSRFNKAGFAALFSLWNASAVGAIMETAGRVNSSGRPQMGNHGRGSTQKFGQSNYSGAGHVFVGSMNGIGALKPYKSATTQKHRSTGRLLYATYADRQGKTLDAIMKAIDLASKKLEARAKPVFMREAA